MVMTQRLYILLGILLLSACAHTPFNQAGNHADNQAGNQIEGQVENQTGQTAAKNDAGQPDQAGSPEPQSETPQSLPNIELNSDLLYEYLLSEIAAQRGNDAVAIDGSLELAKKTRDPRLAMGAAHMALQFGQIDKAIEALKIWRDADPSSLMARRMLSSVLLRSGKMDEASKEFTELLKADADRAALNFIQIYQMLATYTDKTAALKLMRDLAQPYPGIAEAHWAVAQLAQASGDGVLALNEAKQAHKLRPEWDVAVSLEALLLMKDMPQQGLDLLGDYLSSYPDAHDIRLQYARTLVDQKQYKSARKQFQVMADEDPDNPEFAYAIALISLQLNDLKSAEKQLKQALSKGKKDQDTVQYYLGQLSEAKKNGDEAIGYYRRVKDGEYLLAARVRIAFLLSKRGQLGEARQLLHEAKATDNQQRVKLVMVEAQLLREANQNEEAYRILNQSLEKLPNHADLLYETAMMADKIGKPVIFEELMRKLIKIKPDHAQAYNALGYSMLDRNENIPEAMALVEKALQLDPNDAAIMDSVGWGYYRSGKLDESVKMLRRAYAGDANPEIAAHLGEVLWMRGDKTEAKKIWQDSLKENSGNAPLQAVIKKFDP